MAGSSLLMLLDDIAAVLDDVALMTKVAAKKTAGVLGDDLALNAQQVSGVRADRARHVALSDLASCPGVDVEYLEVVHRESVIPITDERTTDAVVVVAAVVGGVRLIDNCEVAAREGEPT